MPTLTWNQVADDFGRARLPLRIAVVEPTEPDWRAVLQMASKERLDVRLEVSGEERPASEVGSWLFARGAAPGRVVITHAGVEFARAQWDRREVALEVAPGQITDQAGLDAVLEFMSGMEEATGKPVELESTDLEPKLLARVERGAAGVFVDWRPTVSMPHTSPLANEKGPGHFAAIGAVGCLGIFMVLALLALLSGGVVRIHPLGVLMLLSIGGVIGLIAWSIYSAGQKSVR